MLEFIKNLTYSETAIMSMFTTIPFAVGSLIMRDYWRVHKIVAWEKPFKGYKPDNVDIAYKYIYGKKVINYSTSTTKLYFVLKHLRRKFKRNPQHIQMFLTLLNKDRNPALSANELITLINEGFDETTLQHKMDKQYSYSEIINSNGLPSVWSDRLFIHKTVKVIIP